MRKMVLGLTAVAGLAIVFTAAPAAADPYKWCAELSGGMGSTNCGYITREQCQASVHAEGGFCRPNPFYTGEADKAERAVKPARTRNPG